MTVMTHVKVLQAGHSSQGTSEPITPAFSRLGGRGGGVPTHVIVLYYKMGCHANDLYCACLYLVISGFASLF